MLKKDKTKKYFLVYEDEKQILGVIDFNEISETSCEFGLYANPHLKGVGEILMQEIKNYAFSNLKVKSLKASVKKDNEKALNLYLRNGFKIASENENLFFVVMGGGGIVKFDLFKFINSQTFFKISLFYLEISPLNSVVSKKAVV